MSSSFSIGPKSAYKYEKPTPKVFQEDTRERSKTFTKGISRPPLIQPQLDENHSCNNDVSKIVDDTTSILDFQSDICTFRHNCELRPLKLEEIHQPNQPYIEAETINGFYKGGLKDGLPHGCGELSTRQGSVYYGDFKRGLKDGYGNMKFAGGNIQNGRWVKDYYIGTL